MEAVQAAEPVQFAQPAVHCTAEFTVSFFNCNKKSYKKSYKLYMPLCLYACLPLPPHLKKEKAKNKKSTFVPSVSNNFSISSICSSKCIQQVFICS